jgi:uncharacterized protein involved in exopolysaccharide biosynthesis
MRDVQEMKDRLEQLRQNLDEAKAAAEKLAKVQVIHPAVPAQKRRYLPPDPTF